MDNSAFLPGEVMMGKLTHLDSQGRANMVDVSDKDSTDRVAVATGRVLMQAATLDLIAGGESKKGDVLGTARIAGIQAAKRCADLIPLCHPLMLTSVKLELSLDPAGPAVDIKGTCKVSGQTGVEMEALTAVSVAALTVYDMCKAVDKGMIITDISLQEKSGGRSGHYTRS